MWKSTFAALIVLFAAGCAKAQPPIWVVRDQDSEMVLFGSVHVLPKGLDWTPPALDRALSAADDLWFELSIDAASESRVAALAMDRGVLPADMTLSGLLSRDGAARLQRVAVQYGLTPDSLERLEPWLAEVALAGAAFRKANADASSGVEKSLSAAAPAKTARRAFETPEEQIALFDDGPMSEQVASLESTLRDMEDNPGQYEELVADWMAGDLGALEREALDPIRDASPGLYRRLVTERNARWTTVLDKRLAGSGKTVVVVGVGHLIGADGVPARLRALGYSVEGP
jgi:uncharacterized protein YbaP (TraB family)